MNEKNVLHPGLYIIPTPIGNLKDITLRALEYLQAVDLLLAEDTRKTSTLLRHYSIQTPMKAYHQHNEHRLTQGIIEMMKSGKRIGLVSDAGTPGISDAGFLLVRAAVEAQLHVECLPGPTAFVPALVKSAIPADRFCFEGFLPVKKGRKSRLEALAQEKRTIILYESPHRLLKTLTQLSEYLGESRYAAVSRELTKIYEETIRGSLNELVAHFTRHPPRGEFVIVVSGMDK